MASPFGSGFGAGGLATAKSSNSLTPIQQAQMEFLQKELAKGQGRSFWDRVKDGAGGVFGPIFNVMLRPNWAATSFIESARGPDGDLSPGDFFSSFFKGANWAAAREGLAGRNQKGFGELIESSKDPTSNWLKEHDFTRGATGFLFDVALDPTTFLTFGTGTAVSGGAKGLLTASRRLHTGLDNGAEAKKLAQLFNDAGQDFEARKGLAELFAKKFDDPDNFDLLDRDRFAAMSRSALSEEEEWLRKIGGKRIQAKWAGLPLHPVQAAGVKLSPRRPDMFRKWEARGDKAGKFNVLGKAQGGVANLVGKAFKPEWEDGKITHDFLITSRHQSERLSKEYEDLYGQVTKPFEKMDLDTKLDALDVAETTKGIIKDHAFDEDILKALQSPSGYKYLDPDSLVVQRAISNLEKFSKQMEEADKIRKAKKKGTSWQNKEYLKAKRELEAAQKRVDDAISRETKTLKLTPEQVEYVRAIHQHGEFLRHADAQYRVPYDREIAVGAGEKGVLYVPHPLSPSVQSPWLQKRTPLTKAGYQHERAKGLSSVKAIREFMKESGLEKDVHPDTLFVRRSRRGASKHADQTYKENLLRTFGIKLNLADEQELSKLREVAEELDSRLKSFKSNNPEEAYQEFLQKELQRKLGTKRLKELKRIAEIETQGGKKVPAKVRKARQKRYETELAAARKRAENAAQRRVQRVLREEKKSIEYTQKRIQVNQIRQLRASLGLKNPQAYDEKGRLLPHLKRLPKYRLEDGSAVAIDARVNELLHRAEKVYSGIDDRTLQAWDTAIGKLTRHMKFLYTVVNPGYRVRNSVSDYWAMWLESGMDPATALAYSLKAHRLIAKALKGGDHEAEAIFREAWDQGLLSTQMAGDVSQLSHLKEAGVDPGITGDRIPVWGLYARTAATLNRNFENAPRLGHYLYLTRVKKVPPSEAAQRIRVAHFDYEDLTELERERFKKLALFYTWSRKNLPFQLQSLITKPGRFSAFPKGVQEMEEAAEDSEGDILPSFLREGFAFKVPVGDNTYTLPGIGAMDLSNIENPGKAALSLMNPLFKVPAEVLSGTNLDTGQPIQGTHPRNPINEAVGDLLRRVPGNPLDVGPTERTGRGGTLEGMGANPWVSYAAQQLPMANVLVNSSSAIRTAQRGTPWWMSYGAGQSAFDLDPEQQQLIQELEFRNKFRRYIRGLRDEDVFAESDQMSDEPSDFDQQLALLLQSVYGRS